MFLNFLGADDRPFNAPGAHHRARWMAKAVYCLKIWLFRDQFVMSEEERDGVYSLCLFIIRVYVRFWFVAPEAISAARNDLNLFKVLLNYQEKSLTVVEQNMYEAAAAKFARHQWYLSHQNIALAFFDEKIPVVEKKKMVLALKTRSSTQRQLKRDTTDLKSYRHLTTADCVSSSTISFFDITGISRNFLKEDPEMWSALEEYKQGKAKLINLRVVNDCAERGVALIQKFCGHLTKDEEQLQYLLRVVQNHRQHLPDPRRRTILLDTPKK